MTTTTPALARTGIAPAPSTRAACITRSSTRTAYGTLRAETVLAAMLAMLLTACGSAESDAAAAKEADGAAPTAAVGPPAMGVEVVVAQRDTVAEEIALTGRVEAVDAIEVRPEVNGRIVQVLVREGQPVGRGAALFKIDDAELRPQVARATAERDLARQTLERTTGLLAQNASAAADLERAEATARSAQAALDQLAVRLDRTTVRAPFAGVTGQRLVSLGDYVTLQTPLISLQTTNPQRVVLTVPERYAAELNRGQRVVFRIAAFPEEDFSARVEFVDPVVQLPARTITIKALAQNSRGRLQPGMFVEARLATAVRPNAVVIPEDAVMPAPGGTNAVWVVQNGKAVRREVTLGVRSAGFVEATSGVAAGEPVVVGGVMQLTDGAPVEATEVTRGANVAQAARGGAI